MQPQEWWITLRPIGMCLVDELLGTGEDEFADRLASINPLLAYLPKSLPISTALKLALGHFVEDLVGLEVRTA